MYFFLNKYYSGLLGVHIWGMDGENTRNGFYHNILSSVRKYCYIISKSSESTRAAYTMARPEKRLSSGVLGS